MQKNTMLSEEIIRLQRKEYLDESAKKLLGYRVICAFILKHCIKEFENYTVEYIANECIQGDPLISKKSVHQHSPDNPEKDNSEEIPEKIPETKSEDSDLNEGTVRYDVIFEVIVPGESEQIKLIINIEAQNIFNPGYPLVTRGFYYDARMISAQYGKEFSESDYGKIKKVYSIWVCIDPDINHRNTITRFYTVAENIFGNSESREEDYNKMEVILIGLQTDVKNESENLLIDMLSTLFSKKMNANDKRKKLENKHGIAMKKEYNEVIDKMCNISSYYSREYDDAMKKLNKALARADDAEARADDAEARAVSAEERARNAEKELAMYKANSGKLN